MKPPEDMPQVGKDLWTKLYPEVASGGWCESRKDILEMICQQHAIRAAAFKELEGGMIVETRSGPKENPAYTVVNKAENQKLKGYKALNIKGDVSLDDDDLIDKVIGGQ